MPTEWFVQKNGKQHGPMSSAQLKQLADSGRLDRNDQVRRSDQTSFVPAERIQGLFPEVVPVPLQQQAIPIAATAVAGSAPASLISKLRNKPLLLAAIGIGCLFLFFVLALFVAGANSSKAKAAVAEADRLWDSGKKNEALSQYRILLDNTWLGDGDKPRVFGRVIDTDLEKGDRAAATSVMAQAEKRKIIPLVNSKEAQHLVSEMQLRLAAAEAERKKQAEQRSKSAAPSSHPVQADDGTRYTVKKGWGSSLTVELTLDAAQEFELSNFAWEGSKLTFNLKCKDIVTMKKLQCDVFDKDGVRITSDDIWPINTKGIGLGETVKAHLFAEDKDNAARILIRHQR